MAIPHSCLLGSPRYNPAHTRAMKKLIPFLTLIFAFNLVAAPKGQLTYETPEAAAKDPDFLIQGEYTEKAWMDQEKTISSACKS